MSSFISFNVHRYRYKRRKKVESSGALTSFPWRELYRKCITEWGISPSDYWLMSPDEISLLIDGNKEVVMYGSMSQYDVDELVKMHDSGDFI